MFVRLLTILSFAIPVTTAIVLWSWPEAARPHVPVPPLIVGTDSDKTQVQAELETPRSGMISVPMRVTGRAAPGVKGALLQEWPGFQAEARFQGNAVSVRFADKLNRWRILIDDGKAGRIELSRPGVSDLRIRGLAPGPHHIRVEKISESSMPASFGGILIDDESGPLPAPPGRPLLIEFIGDSDTVGFGSTSSTRNCREDEIFATTDTSRAFGPKVAAALGADYRLIARSGIGLLRNYQGMTPQATMSLRYPLALPGDPQASRIPDRKADVVVTGLGSNDFGSALSDGEPWSDHTALSRDFATALDRFLRERSAENPGALQVLLAFGEYGDALVAPYRRAEAALRADGIRAVLIVLPKLQRNACMWHPSERDHDLIATLVGAAIAKATRP